MHVEREYETVHVEREYETVHAGRERDRVRRVGGVSMTDGAHAGRALPARERAFISPVFTPNRHYDSVSTGIVAIRSTAYHALHLCVMPVLSRPITRSMLHSEQTAVIDDVLDKLASGCKKPIFVSGAG